MIRPTLLIISALCVFNAWCADRLLIIGDATWGGWSLDRSAVMVADTQNRDIWRYTGYLKADKEFKFLTECCWDRLEYRNASPSPYIEGAGAIVACTGNVADYKFKVSESANYDIECNLADLTISVTKSEYQTHPILHNALYLVGDATPGGWLLPAGSALYSTPQSLLTYSGTYLLQPGIFKLATNCHGGYTEQKFYHRDAADATRVSEDISGDLQWRIERDGLYTVTVDLEAMTIDIRSTLQSTTLGALQSWSDEQTYITFQCEGGMLQVTPYADGIFKVFTLPAGSDARERRSISVCAVPVCSYAVSETKEDIVITTSTASVRVRRADANVSFHDASGRVILREQGGLNNSAIPRRIDFDAMGDMAFYGGGYNGRYTDLDGVTLTMDNTQTGGWDNTWSAPHNICIPFIVSTSGYGLLIDDYYRGAKLRPSSSGTTYVSGSHSPVAYYFIGSEDGGMASVMKRYTHLTGRQPLPPYWALGYMTSRYGYHSSREAEEVVDGIRNASLPLDAIVFDLYWQGEGNSGMGNLDWYRPLFPNPQKMMSDFASKGVKTICITEPFFTSESSNYETLRRNGWLADEDVSGMEWLGAPKAGLIDSSNPAAMDWMWHYYKTRSQEGVAGWWLDLGEPERHDSDSRHMGGTVEEVHNEFADLWTSRVYRGYREEMPSVRPFLMPRAGTAGMQRYSTFPWTGDIRRSYAGLAAQVPALLSASMSGIGYMGNDVGGFAAETNDPSLYLRWIEMSTFSPMMRTHGTKDPEPHLQCYADVLPHVRTYLNLRYSYLPYTYTLAWENAVSGMPLARPLNFHERRATESTSSSISQYLWGRDIMVAPVLDSGVSREVIFPEGEWLDLSNLITVYRGGTTVQYDAPLETLPHFARMGAFIPRYSAEQYTNTAEIDQSALTILYTALLASDEGSEVTSYLYDDDRLSPATLEREEYAVTTFTGRNHHLGHDIEISVEGAYPGMPATRTYSVCVPGYHREVTEIRCAGGAASSEVLRKVTEDEYEAGAVGCYTHSAGGMLRMRVAHAMAGKMKISIADGGNAAVGTLLPPTNTLRYYRHTHQIDIPSLYTPSSLVITDLHGAEVCRVEVSPSDVMQHITLPALPTGMYFITLSGYPPLKAMI